jgi:hypothetical protein
MRIGLVSDTHGLVRPEALAFLAGSNAIVHAGDIGRPEVLRALQALAPLHAVRGNNDTGAWAQDLPDSLVLELGGVRLFVLHDLHTLEQFPAPAGTQVVVCGHSHKPRVQPHPSGFLVVNPGSAGPRRFSLPVSAAELHVDAHGRFDVKLATLL